MVSAVGIFHFRKVPSHDHMDECFASFRLPCLNVDVFPVIASAQRIALDLWRHDALPVGRLILSGAHAAVKSFTTVISNEAREVLIKRLAQGHEVIKFTATCEGSTMPAAAVPVTCTWPNARARYINSRSNRRRRG